MLGVGLSSGYAASIAICTTIEKTSILPGAASWHPDDEVALTSLLHGGIVRSAAAGC